MLVERYSDHSFEPQYQDHLMGDVKYYENDWELNKEEYFSGVNEAALIRMERTFYKDREFFLENKSYFKYGIWVFPYGEADMFYLNHLSTIPSRHVADIPENVIAFDISLREKSTLGKLIKCPELYIPDCSLSRIKVIE